MMTCPTNNLPDWLWPTEDEEAVLEAERLIEDTHRKLQKMENDILHEVKDRDQFGVKTEKMKSFVMNKINSLEVGLKDISKTPTSSRLYQPLQQLEDQLSSKGISNSRQTYKTVKSQEKDVLTAHEKIRDALQVARSVSASLDHHASISCATLKPVSPLKAANVGIFEVKSQKGETEEKSIRSRLSKSQVSSLSIKRNLECQLIPSIHLPPCEKPVPKNVMLYHAQHKGGKSKKPVVTDSNEKSLASWEKESDAKEELVCKDSDSDIAQLSRQLAQVEELRELNQAQVNHVLRFLVSKVTALSNTHPPPEQLHSSPSTSEKLLKKSVNFSEPETSLTSQSSHSSNTSGPKIAYDSLSRFLETYRQAANQALLAEKKASVRRKEVAMRHQKDIKYARKSIASNAVIDPQNQNLSKVIENTEKPEKPLSDSETLNTDQSFKTQNESAECNDYATNFVIQKDGNPTSNSLAQEKVPLVFSSITHTSATDSSEAHISKSNGDDYEDDWEEDVFENSTNANQEHVDSLVLKTILEVEENPLQPHLNEAEHQHLNSDSKVPVSVSLPHPMDFGTTPKALESDKISFRIEVPKVGVKVDSTVPVFGTVPVSAKESPIISGEFTATSDEGSMPKKTEFTPSVAPPSKFSRAAMIRKTSRVRQLSSCSSSSDVDDTFSYERVPFHRKNKDLQVKDDVHLKSSVFLERQQKNVSVYTLDDAPLVQSQVLTDVEERWKRALHELDERIQAMEKHENVSHILQKLKVSTREEQTQTSPIAKKSNEISELKLNSDDSLQWNKGAIVVSIPQTCSEKDSVQKGSIKNGGISLGREIKQSSVGGRIEDSPQEISPKNTNFCEPSGYDFKAGKCSRISSEKMLFQHQSRRSDVIKDGVDYKQATGMRISDQESKPLSIRVAVNNILKAPRAELTSYDHKESDLLSHLIRDHGLSSSHRLWPPSNRDLTEDLLAYTQMGIVSKSGTAVNVLPASLSSSSSSSLLPSNFRISLSDGEMLTNASGSCSCSDGEVCLCSSGKGQERAPPDGSHAPENKGNSFKDVSQGEIAVSEGDLFIGDSSQGEIPSRNTPARTSPAIGMGTDSDDLEDNNHPA